MQVFMHSSKLLISAGLLLCVSLSGCGGGGGSTGISNTSAIGSASLGQDNTLSSVAASSANTQSSSSSNSTASTDTTSESSLSESQILSSVTGSVANSIANTSVRSSSEDNNWVDSSESVTPNISSIGTASSSIEPPTVSSSTASTSLLSFSSSSTTSVAISSSFSSATPSSSKAATSSASSSSLTQISSSSIASSSFIASSSSPSTTGTSFHLRGTHNAWAEGDLFTQVVGSTTDLEICRNFLPTAGGPNFKIDPNGGWAGDEFPASSVAASGWTRIVINGTTRTIQSITKDLTLNCGVDAGFSSASTQASSSSAASSSLGSFSFPSINDVPINTEITSKEATISGLRGTAFIYSEGGEYSIDNDYFSSDERQVFNGQSVKIKIKSAATTNTSKQASVIINDVKTSFVVTTMPDTTPDTFSFTPVFNSQLNKSNVSNVIIVTGIDGPTPISIVGDKAIYYINNKPQSNTPSTVMNGQTVKVSLASSDKVNTVTSATLTIGGVSRNFTVMTVTENSAPTAKFVFPSLNSLANKNSILVRGKSSDTNSIVSVKVNGIEVSTNDNYANWQLNVPLEKGDNILTVSTEDSLKNYFNNAASIKVRYQSSNTPDNINIFDGPVSIALDSTHNRLIVGDFKSGDAPLNNPDILLYLVDLNNGSRTFFDEKNSWISSASDIAIDASRNRALVVDLALGNIIAVDLTHGKNTIFSSDAIPNTNFPLSIPCCIAIDSARNRAIVADYGLNALIAIDLTTGARTVLSSNTIPNSINAFYKPYGIVIDAKNNRVLVADNMKIDKLLFGAIVAVDLTTGARTIVTNYFTPETTYTSENPYAIALDEKRNRVLVSEIRGGNPHTVDLSNGSTRLLANLDSGNGMAVDSNNDVAYIANFWLKSVVLLDLITGEKVVFSK